MQSKKPTRRKVLAAASLALLFSIGAGGAAGLSYYKSTVGLERINFKLALPEGTVKPIDVDMSAHGLPKRIFQPNSIRLRARSIRNEGAEPLPVMIAFNGIPGSLAVKSGGEPFDPTTQFKVIKPGGKWKFDIYIHLPSGIDAATSRINGQMVVSHATDQTILATIPISIFWSES